MDGGEGDLNEWMVSSARHHIVVVLGDLNARVEDDGGGECGREVWCSR